jgi:hypothetical protein
MTDLMELLKEFDGPDKEAIRDYIGYMRIRRMMRSFETRNGPSISVAQLKEILYEFRMSYDNANTIDIAVERIQDLVQKGENL